jgi:hypothetical protein
LELQSLDGEAAVAIPGNGSGGVSIVEYNSPPTGDAMVYCGSFDGQGFTKVVHSRYLNFTIA